MDKEIKAILKRLFDEKVYVGDPIQEWHLEKPISKMRSGNKSDRKRNRKNRWR